MSTLKTVNTKVIGTLVCRGIESRHLRIQNDKDLLDKDFDKAEKLRNEFDNARRALVLDRALKAKKLIDAGKAIVDLGEQVMLQSLFLQAFLLLVCQS